MMGVILPRGAPARDERALLRLLADGRRATSHILARDLGLDSVRVSAILLRLGARGLAARDEASGLWRATQAGVAAGLRAAEEERAETPEPEDGE